jgi:hypothetical protein
MTALADIEAAWAEGTGDQEAVRALADAYVTANPAEFTELAGLSIEQLVTAVDVFRAAGLVESQQRVEVWLWHHFEPQNIGGTHEAIVRTVA